MTNRMLDILKILLENEGRSSYKYLSENLFINERSIRYDIEKINELLSESHFILNLFISSIIFLTSRFTLTKF